VQKAVGRHEVDLRVVRPAREELSHDSRRRALADRDAARQPDDVRDLRHLRAEEGRRRPVQALARVDVQVQQSRERKVDVGNLVERDALVEATQLGQIALAQRERGVGPEPRPFGAREREVA
jgi:hypothetical protein